MMQTIPKKFEGKLPKKPEIGEWSEPKLVAFFNFANYFMKEGETRGKVGIVYDVSDERIANAWEIEEPYWQEFMTRLVSKGMDAQPKTQRLNAFRTRLMNFIRTVGAWVKANPHAVSIQMEQIMRANPRFSWALDAFQLERTEIGGVIVVPNTAPESVDPTLYNQNPNQTDSKLPAVQYHNAVAKMTSLLLEVVGSVDRTQLKGLPTEKKLKLALHMLDTLGKTMKDAPTPKSVFNTIVVNKGGREELEQTILEYANPKD
jgi:hypothetical protein